MFWRSEPLVSLKINFSSSADLCDFLHDSNVLFLFRTALFSQMLQFHEQRWNFCESCHFSRKTKPYHMYSHLLSSERKKIETKFDRDPFCWGSGVANKEEKKMWFWMKFCKLTFFFLGFIFNFVVKYLRASFLSKRTQNQEANFAGERWHFRIRWFLDFFYLFFLFVVWVLLEGAHCAVSKV